MTAYLELADYLLVRPGTIRFYERAGALPRAASNRYRQYGEVDAQRLRDGT